MFSLVEDCVTLRDETYTMCGYAKLVFQLLVMSSRVLNSRLYFTL